MTILSLTRLRHPRNPPPLPPLPNPLIDLPRAHPIPYQKHRHPQTLHIPIPRLIIKEQHLCILNPARPPYPLEMSHLTPRIYLHVIEHFYRLPRLPRSPAGILQRRQMQQLQHLPRHLRRLRPARQSQLHAALLQRHEDGRHILAEGERFAEPVDAGRVGRRGLQRRRAVRVDPEGPQRVVEVEDDEARERLEVCEGGGRGRGERGEGGAGGGGVEGFGEFPGHGFEV
jgi:hypothetical protein